MSASDGETSLSTTVGTNISQRLDRLPISWLHRRLLLIHGCGWLFDAMDVGIITFVLAALAREWKLPSDQVGLIGSAGMAGMFVGALVSGIVADFYGRKTVFQWTLLIFCIATALCALAWSVTSMVVFRFLVGLGLGGELPVVASLLSEFIPRQKRAKYVVLLESFWAYGWFIAAVIAYFVIPAFGWRIAFAIGFVPAAYVFIVRRALPESPRWCESKGNMIEADAITSTLEKESEGITGIVLPPLEFNPANGTSSSPALGFMSLWQTPYLRHTLVLWVLWFGLVFGYYGIFVWLPTLLVKSGYSLVSSFGYVVWITFWQIPGYYSAAALIERIGRKPVIVSYLSLSAFAAYMFGHASSNVPLMFWACAMSFFNLGAWGAVYAYTPELYPTRIRATGFGSAVAFGRIGGILAPFVVGILLPTIGREGVLTLNAGLFLLAGGAVGLFGIETKGRVLE